ncbi:hypothetical protein JXD20_03950 [Candidatus Peregrinibacteria bacterium]|nr:hypothetical protein [Candidatus Peregrinibacteria bacterium]
MLRNVDAARAIPESDQEIADKELETLRTLDPESSEFKKCELNLRLIVHQRPALSSGFDHITVAAARLILESLNIENPLDPPDPNAISDILARSQVGALFNPDAEASGVRSKPPTLIDESDSVLEAE